MLDGRTAVLVLALCLALISDSAQSQRRSRQQPVGAQNQPTAQPPAPDQRGTDQVPLAVKIQPATDAKEKAETEERQRNERARLDAEKARIDEKIAFETQRIADYTDRLALFTKFLFVVAVLQAGLFVWQLLLINKTTKDASVATRAARRSAVASVTQAKIARDTLTKVQRPYIFVVGADRLASSDQFPNPHLIYEVVNYGQTPAIIETVNVGFFSGQLPEVPIQVDFDHPLVISTILPPQDQRKNLREFLPDEYLSGDIGVVVGPTINEPHQIPVLHADDSLFFRVIIAYRGPFAGGYETSVTWTYNLSAERFVQLNDATYNYTR
jgi:hypothetical protein